MSAAPADTVTLYTTPTCPWCSRVRTFLDERKVKYVEKDVAADQTAAMEMVRRSGQQGVPVTAAGDEVVVGFDQPGLTRLIERFAGPKRPPLGVLGADAASYLTNHPEQAQGVPEGTTGVYVGVVRPGSVAEQAGLAPGDIIVGLAGKRVRSMRQLDEFVAMIAAGEQTTVHYLRQGETNTATLDFAARETD
jgi:glutaredoxin-like YruB-family protein